MSLPSSPGLPGGGEARGLPAGQLPGGGAVHSRHPGPGPAPLCSRHCPPPQPRCGPEVVLQGPAGRDPRCTGWGCGWGSGTAPSLSWASLAHLSDGGCPPLGPGPFTTQEMAEWFQAGYFSMALLVKRGCDEGFQPLGEVIKMWGRVPFAPGPSPPPLLVSVPPLARNRDGRQECDGGQRWVQSQMGRAPGTLWPHSGEPGPGAAEEAAGAGSGRLVPAAAAPAVSPAGRQVRGA